MSDAKEVFRFLVHNRGNNSYWWVFCDDGSCWWCGSDGDKRRDGDWKVVEGKVYVNTTVNSLDRWDIAKQSIQNAWIEIVERSVAEVIVT